MLEHLTITDLTSPQIAESCRLGIVWAHSLEQERILAGTATKRLEQKQLGLRAVEQAMAKLSPGVLASEVTRGPAGEPIWPEGISGSLSHSRFLALAAVSNSPRIKSLGIDVQEMETPRKEAVFRRLFQVSELAWVLASGSFDMERAFQLFCLKESAYKAVFSLNGHRLKSSEVSFEAKEEGFEARFSLPELSLLSVNAKAATYQGYAAAMLSLS